MSTQERIDEPTPNGGDYSIAFFQDDNGNPASKSVATRIEIIEYAKDGTEVFRSYLEQSAASDDVAIENEEDLLQSVLSSL